MASTAHSAADKETVSEDDGVSNRTRPALPNRPINQSQPQAVVGKSVVRRLAGSDIQLQSGIERGIEQGREQGICIGRIHLCQQRLGQPLIPMDQLFALSIGELRRRAEELESELFASE